MTPESSTSLRVTWEPPARDLWNGNILGYYVGYKSHVHATDYNIQTVEVRPPPGVALPRKVVSFFVTAFSWFVRSLRCFVTFLVFVYVCSVTFLIVFKTYLDVL